MPSRALPNRHSSAHPITDPCSTTATQNCTVLFRTARCRTTTSRYQSPAHKTTPVHCDTLPYLTGPCKTLPQRYYAFHDLLELCLHINIHNCVFGIMQNRYVTLPNISPRYQHKTKQDQTLRDTT